MAQIQETLSEDDEYEHVSHSDVDMHESVFGEASSIRNRRKGSQDTKIESDSHNQGDDGTDLEERTPSLPPSADIANEFSKLIEIASKIKSAQPEVREKREKWENMPSFLKNTLLYETEEDKQMRDSSTDFHKRLQFAESLKEEGNRKYKEKAFDEASARYHRACGVFRYAIKSRTKDGDQVDEIDATKDLPSEQREQALQLQYSCLINEAACNLESAVYDEVITSCEAALALPCKVSEQMQVKALFRAAMANYKRENLDVALSLLDRAQKLMPSDVRVRSELVKITKEKQLQNEKDKQTFSGMFDRGQIYDETPSPSASSSTSSSSPITSETEKFMRDYVARYKDASSSKIDPSIKHAQTMADLKRMQEGAAKFGLDLNDPLIQAELVKLQQDDHFKHEKEDAIQDSMRMHNSLNNQQTSKKYGKNSLSSSSSLMNVNWIIGAVIAAVVVYACLRYGLL